MAGLVDVGRSYASNAMQGMTRVSSMEEARERVKKGLNAQAEMQEDSDRKSSVATGAGLGAAAAMSSAYMGATYGAWAGPIGMVAGAAVGFLLNELF
jgi:hypothetical protein